MQPPATAITVARTTPNDIGIRDVRVWLDNQLIATLLNRQSVTRALEPGEHTLRVHNTFVGKRLSFSIAAGEHIHFITSNRSGCATSLLVVLGAGPIYISLERLEHLQGSS